MRKAHARLPCELQGAIGNLCKALAAWCAPARVSAAPMVLSAAVAACGPRCSTGGRTCRWPAFVASREEYCANSAQSLDVVW